MRDVLPKLPGLAALVSLAVSLAHCANPIDAPSAFSAERYLCGPEHAAEFEAFLQDCRTRGQSEVCNGILSLRGTIDSEEVVIDTWVDRATPSDWPGDRGTARAMELLAASAYFNIKLDVHYLAVPPLTSYSGELPENCSAQPELTFAPCMILNLEARGGNFLSGVATSVRTIELETATEMRASFSGEFARGGHIDGCFHIFLREPR